MKTSSKVGEGKPNLYFLDRSIYFAEQQFDALFCNIILIFWIIITHFLDQLLMSILIILQYFVNDEIERRVKIGMVTTANVGVEASENNILNHSRFLHFQSESVFSFFLVARLL